MIGRFRLVLWSVSLCWVAHRLRLSGTWGRGCSGGGYTPTPEEAMSSASDGLHLTDRIVWRCGLTAQNHPHPLSKSRGFGSVSESDGGLRL